MIFTISLLLRSLYLTFAPLVTLVKSYVFTKLDVSAAFLSRENRTHGTDEHLTRPIGRGSHKKCQWSLPAIRNYASNFLPN